jgi:hypothetical protein
MKVRLWREGRGARRANAPPILFQHKNSFLAIEEAPNKTQKYFLNNYLGRVRTEK